jgi:hypothetical protein
VAAWLAAATTELSEKNRKDRWKYVREHLPNAGEDDYLQVPYQLMHRCAAAVVEAKRLGLKHAAFVVQAFQSPVESFEYFCQMCRAMGFESERGRMHLTSTGDVQLGIGWADCPMASDEQVAAVA